MRVSWVASSPTRDRGRSQSVSIARRGGRIAALVATGVLGLFAVGVCLAIAGGAAARGELGWDLGLYLRNTQRWLATGELYRPWQMNGPYEAVGEVNLYPPLALYLFLPFLWLPGLLWWLIPSAVTAWVLWLHRPPSWTWPFFAAVAATVPFGAMAAHGNSGLWVLAIVSAATVRPAFAVLLAFKPSVLPVAFLFAYRRSWWTTAALVMIAAVPFGLTAWVEFLVISRNLQGETPLYSLHTVPIVAAPIVAWLAGRRSPLPLLELGTRRLVVRRQARLLPMQFGVETTAPEVGGRRDGAATAR